MKLLPLLLALVPALFISCERHEFEETRKLHEHHDAHTSPGHDTSGTHHEDDGQHPAEEKGHVAPAH